jgi:hypothetical protein
MKAPPAWWISGAQKFMLAQRGRFFVLKMCPAGFQCTRSVDENVG